jgi:hypothetical protein
MPKIISPARAPSSPRTPKGRILKIFEKSGLLFIFLGELGAFAGSNGLHSWSVL